ncbi:MAG: hypothetical protein ABS897_01740, partial [Eubacteriales bacterium]
MPDFLSLTGVAAGTNKHYFVKPHRGRKEGNPMTEKRVLKTQETKGFSIQDLIIVAVLLAAG